jgi:nitrogen regulatory protein PII
MSMKAVLITHNVALEPDVNEALNEAGVECYTRFTNVLGRGKISEPHLSTDVWPGVNWATLVVTDPKKAASLMNIVRRLREKLGSEGIKAFMWEIEDMT